MPGAASLYHRVTCEYAGSQAFHAPKLAAVWTGYAALWEQWYGLPRGNARIWVHDAGWTPISAFASFMITGRAATLTNSHARVLGRYGQQALQCALAMPLEQTGLAASTLAARRAALQAAVHREGAIGAVQALGGRVVNKNFTGSQATIGAGLFDLCHSGNALEHYPPTALRRFLATCVTSLRRGGIASHVVDHRDHLHHVDRTWPFLLHRSLPERAYRMLFGHVLLYHNRLTPTQMMACLESVGLERVMVRRAGADLVYKPDEEVLRQPSGVPAWTQTCPAWARVGAGPASPLDARTTYAHYVYRKR